MPTATETDIIYAHVITNRILLRQLLEDLRDRPGSKYFKNIIIRDIPWEKHTLRHYFPKNFPPAFLRKYPFDFEATFNTLGCNMLKCYRPRLAEEKRCNKAFRPIIMSNQRICANSEACFEVFNEFNQYLIEKFDLKLSNNNNNDINVFPFETFSIKDGTTQKEYCGIQLSALKTFSILPEARWHNPDDDDNISAKEYIMQNEKKNNFQPLRLRELAGLVDAPPLTWNVNKQTANFNHRYCARFNKTYDKTRDECFYGIHRKVFNFFLGKNLVDQFPDLQDVLINGSIPLEYVTHHMMGSANIRVNRHYRERQINQAKLERKMYHDIPDKVTEQEIKIISTLNPSMALRDFERQKTQVTNIFSDIFQDLVLEMGIELGSVGAPKVGAHLLKHYSLKFIQNVLSNKLIPPSVRMFSLTARLVINEVTINFATKLLTSFAKGANIFLAITALTIVPDILLQYYNVGGFNNEISRQHIDKYRENIMNDFLRTNIHSFNDQAVNFISINNGAYVSPIITPEFTYYLCLVNFLETHYDQKLNICHNGLGSEEQIENIALEYLSCLEINSVGQTIGVEEEEEEEEENNSLLSILQQKTYDKNDIYIIQQILYNNIDMYVLVTGLIFLYLSIFFLFKYPKISCIFVFLTLICFTIWFKLFQPYIQKMQV